MKSYYLLEVDSDNPLGDISKDIATELNMGFIKTGKILKIHVEKGIMPKEALSTGPTMSSEAIKPQKPINPHILKNPNQKLKGGKKQKWQKHKMS